MHHGGLDRLLHASFRQKAMIKIILIGAFLVVIVIVILLARFFSNPENYR